MRYRKISTHIWNDQKVRKLSDNAKLVWLFILTHPAMTSLGAMRASSAGLAVEIGWGLRRFSAALGEIKREDMIRIDRKSCLIVVPKFVKHNPPENPNVYTHMLAAVELLPECDLLTEHLAAVKELLKGLRKGFSKPSRKGMANPEPEQEQEQERESVKSAEPDVDPLAPAQEDPLAEYPALVAFYAELLDLVQTAHPRVKLPKAGSKAEHAARDTLSRLVRLDGFTEAEVVDALRWVFTSDHADAVFWRGNLASIASLRRTCKSGLRKFASIHERWQAAKDSDAAAGNDVFQPPKFETTLEMTAAFEGYRAVGDTYVDGDGAIVLTRVPGEGWVRSDGVTAWTEDGRPLDVRAPVDQKPSPSPPPPEKPSEKNPLTEHPLLGAFYPRLNKMLKDAHAKARIPAEGSADEEKAMRELAALVDKDGHSQELIVEVLTWVLTEETPRANGFLWRSRFWTVPSLRGKTAGATKFARMAKDYISLAVEAPADA